MSEYTAEDFKNARFAVHESGRAHAMRLTEHEDDPQQWMYQRHMNPRFTKRANDAGMAADGWRPVHERDLDETRKLRADNEALRDQLQARQDVIEMQREVVKEYIDSNHDLRNQVKDLQAALPAPAPLTLDTLREAWENAEITTECHIGDWIIGWLPEAKHFTFHVATIGSSSLPPHSRVYRRAPQPEPWQALADEMEELYDGYSLRAAEAAQFLHERGVRMTGGDET